MRELSLPEIYIGDISRIYIGIIVVYIPMDIPLMNLPSSIRDFDLNNIGIILIINMMSLSIRDLREPNLF